MTFLLSFVFNQNNEFNISEIYIEGNTRMSDQDIKRNARLYAGMEIKGLPEIQQAIKRLWKLERFSNIEIIINSETNEGLILTIIAEELPTLEQVNFKGNKKKSKRSLNEELNLQIGQILSDKIIFDAVNKIKGLYSEKNYHSVIVETALTAGSNDFKKNLTFNITEGPKSKIKKITFKGNNIFSDIKLTQQFKDNKPWKWYFPWRGTLKQNLLQDDKNLLTKFYKNKGYRDFYIKDEIIELSNNGKSYNIIFDIHEGPMYKVNLVSWNGNEVHTDHELTSQLGFKKGDTFELENFELAISDRVSPLYSDKGYFYFQINPIYTPIGKDSLNIHFEIVENNIVRIRKINITGNDKTHDNVIRRELRMFPGDLFSRKKLMDSYRDIFMLNFFDNVIPDIVPVNEDEIDLQIEVYEKSTGQANFSMGYNGLYGFTGGGGFEFPNFRGRGQTLSISYQRGLNNNNSNTNSFNPYVNSQNTLSTSQNTAPYQSISISFTEPWLFNTPNLVGGSYFYTEKGQGIGNYLPFDIKQHGGSLRWGRRFKWPDYFFRGSWMIRGTQNKYIATNQADFGQGFSLDEIDITEENGLYTFSSSGISFTQVITRDSRNHPEFPTKGSRLIWTSTLSGSFLGGNQDYHKHELDLNWFTPLHNKFTVSQIFKSGFLNKINQADGERSVIPPSTRFVMGGTGIPYGEMLRGYDENRVGPFGNTRGGNVMIKYSLEFRLSLSENPTIYGLSFFDMGNVWSSLETVDPFDLKRSAGFGIRVFIPMLGMLGYDIGYGFDATDYDIYINNGNNKPHGWEYHLIFGMPF